MQLPLTNFLKYSIKAKLIAVIVGIVTAVVLVLTASIAFLAIRIMTEESQLQLSKNLRQNEILFTKFLLAQNANLKIWVANPLVQAVFSDPSLHEVFGSSLRASFQKVKDEEPWIINFLLIQSHEVIYNDNEQMVISGETTPKGVIQLEALPENGVAINLKQVAPRLDQNVIIMKHPLTKDGVVSQESFLVLILDLDKVNQELFGLATVGKNGFVSIVGIDTNTSHLYIPQQTTDTVEKQDFQLASQTWQQLSDIPNEFGSIVFKVQDIPDLPFALIGVASINDIREPVIELVRLSIIIGLFALVGGIWVSTAFAIRLITPIAKLTKKARKLTKDTIKLKHFNRFIRESDSDKSNLLVIGQVADELGVLTNTFDAMIEKVQNDSRKIFQMTTTFEKFVPKQFLDRVAAHGIEQIELGKAETTDLTILFSDIRSFTNLTEAITPQEVLNLLNSYFKLMNDAIHEHEGFVDKFIGDAIMALFDSTSGGHGADHAVFAAIKMHEVLDDYNQFRFGKGQAPIAFGVGIHSGDVIIGTVGSSDRMDTTVLGDAVNLASRIEALTKYYQTKIIISQDTYKLIDDVAPLFARELDFVYVKGKDKPTTIFEVFNNDPVEIRNKKLDTLGLYHEGLMNFYIRKWDDAIALFEECLDILPNDVVPRIFIQRCRQFQIHPPRAQWNGAVEVVQKFDFS